MYSFVSFAGIIRAIRKYGHENMENVKGPGDSTIKRNEKGIKKKENVSDFDNDDDDEAVDDTIELGKLTGKPHPDDLLLFCVPVCGPYSSLQQYTYRIKLTPGNLKRGKAAKQCIEMFLKIDKSKASTSQEKQLDLIKRVPDNDWVQALCADTKISAAGASKVVKATTAKSKKPKK
jgi:NFACT protein C-terminal domain